MFKLDEILLANTVKLEKVLKTDTNFEKLHKRWLSDTVIVIPTECSSRWRFVLYCLKTLHLLQASLHESQEFFIKTVVTGTKETKPHEMTPDTLSFNEQKVVKAALQFVICLGVCPNLLKGVGLPLELRSGFSAFISMAEGKEKVSEHEKNVQLFLCVKVLMSCVKSPALGTLILTQHLVDILASLFQLTHMGSKQIQNEIHKEVKKEQVLDINGTQHKQSETTGDHSTEELPVHNLSPANMVDIVRSKFAQKAVTDKVETKDTDPEKPEMLKEVRNNEQTERELAESFDDIDFKYCEKCLEDLLMKIYPPLLVKTLMLLQGGPKTKVLI